MLPAHYEQAMTAGQFFPGSEKFARQRKKPAKQNFAGFSAKNKN
jgi:hypothetical protein